MSSNNLLYAQSGGVTAVINATASAVIAAARGESAVGDVFGARNGILGVLGERLVDTAGLTQADLLALAATPGGAFGSCRFDLDDPAENPAQFDRLFRVFEAHRIGYFLYNGGNGSMDAVAKLSRAAEQRAYPLTCIGVPKTVDNDLEGTDCSPGFGSAAKYVATSMREAGLDLAAMASRIGRAFVMEVMGRNAGWLAAASTLAQERRDDPPHLVLMPERSLDVERFLARVEAVVARFGYCAVTVSEGIRHADGSPVMEQSHDRKGHVQLGGAGQSVSRMIQHKLGFKSHWSIPDYLQRAAGHLVSGVDRAQAEAVGRAAVRFAVEGRSGVMAAIRRLSDVPYTWDVIPVNAAEIANLERCVPDAFISGDGMGVSEAGRQFLAPLVQGEVTCRYEAGIPVYFRPDWADLRQRLPGYDF
ncbi:MAG: 6-phosphofructokinase [Rhodocyclaceae bacterium]